MAPSLFSLSPAPLSHINTQCTALCTERDTNECAMRSAFRRTADRLHAGMHNRAREHASCMPTGTRSLRHWRKCPKHHSFVNCTCDKRQNGTCQSDARLVVWVRDSVRAAIVCMTKVKTTLSRIVVAPLLQWLSFQALSQVQAASPKLPIEDPFAIDEGRCAKAYTAVHQGNGCQLARMILPWAARTVNFKLLYAISSSSRVKKASNSGRKRRGWVGRIPRC